MSGCRFKNWCKKLPENKPEQILTKRGPENKENNKSLVLDAKIIPQALQMEATNLPNDSFWQTQ